MELLLEILSDSRDAFLGGLGGLTGYLSHYAMDRKSKGVIKVDWVTLFIHVVVGAFVSYCLRDIVPEATPMRDAIMAAIGAAGLAIMIAVENVVVNKIIDKLKF